MSKKQRSPVALDTKVAILASFVALPAFLIAFPISVILFWVGRDVQKHPLGYCEEKGRVLTDNELFTAVLANKLSYKIKTDGTPEFIQTYCQKNKRFCIIYKGREDYFGRSYPDSYLDHMLFGRSDDYVTIQVVYPVDKSSMANKTLPPHEYYEEVLDLHICGDKTGDHHIGFGRTKVGVLITHTDRKKMALLKNEWVTQHAD